MADEQDQAQTAQQDAHKSNALPESVSTGNGDAAETRGKYLRLLSDNKDVAKKYGEPDFQALLDKIGSDGNFAKQFVLAEIAGEDSAKPAIVPDSPQENNITGKMDHTSDTPVKLKADGQTSTPSTAAVETK